MTLGVILFATALHRSYSRIWPLNGHWTAMDGHQAAASSLLSMALRCRWQFVSASTLLDQGGPGFVGVYLRRADGFV